jgi:hypothetical protein
VVLHPSGFGEQSYSAWKGQEGLSDSTGGKNQALYFQKDTLTTTNAAGVAVFKGLEGMQTSQLSPLKFWYGTDGHCGAGAPRFNVRYTPSIGGPNQTFFLGCAGMVPGATMTAPNGRTYQERSFPGPLPPGTVVSVAIVFDEGYDVGRCRGQLGLLSHESCVYLDNIQVGQMTWMSASDNGNNPTADPTGTTFLESLLGESITTALSR